MLGPRLGPQGLMPSCPCSFARLSPPSSSRSLETQAFISLRLWYYTNGPKVLGSWGLPTPLFLPGIVLMGLSVAYIFIWILYGISISLFTLPISSYMLSTFSINTCSVSTPLCVLQFDSGSNYLELAPDPTR